MAGTASLRAGLRAHVRAFGGLAPRVSQRAWVAPGAVVVGDVQIEAEASLWYGVVVRGDFHRVRIGARSNLQDGSVVHVTRDRFPADIGSDVTIGHRAVVHGCTIGQACLIGIGAIVLDGAEIGEGAWVGAGAVVTPGTRIPPGQLALGTPARPIRALSDDERAHQRDTIGRYVQAARQHAAIVPGEPPAASPGEFG